MVKSYYWRLLRTAFWHSLGLADLLSGVVAAGLTVVAHYQPQWGTAMENLIWQIPIWSLAAVALVRLILAPYWLWLEDDKKTKALREELETKNNNHKRIAHLADFLFESNRLMGKEVRSDDELADLDAAETAWIKKVYDYLGENFSLGIANSFIILETTTALQFEMVYNEHHNGIKTRVAEYSKRIRSIVDRFS